MGLASADPVDVKGNQGISQRRGRSLSARSGRGRTFNAGQNLCRNLVRGRKDGKPREVYLYQVADNEACMQRLNCQAVAAQTAVGPAIAVELLAKGIWKSSGVLPPEAFEPEPFLERMAACGFPYGMRDSWPSISSG